ncbi:retrovirus-related Pol polyprotein from transposon 412 [Trichonephila clavipes]|nr:retrovirus-related Pol polyprotein from transposon 412 [Trichonephila clavipes]
MGHVNELPCNMIIDTGANVSIIRNDLAQKLKRNLSGPRPRGYCRPFHSWTGLSKGAGYHSRLQQERITFHTRRSHYIQKATGHQFKEGDKVWFYNPTRRKGLSPKLQSHLDGPYTILKIINDVVIRIRKSTNSKPRVVHYDRLAPYYGHNS